MPCRSRTLAAAARAGRRAHTFKSTARHFPLTTCSLMHGRYKGAKIIPTDEAGKPRVFNRMPCKIGLGPGRHVLSWTGWCAFEGTTQRRSKRCGRAEAGMSFGFSKLLHKVALAVGSELWKASPAFGLRLRHQAGSRTRSKGHRHLGPLPGDSALGVAARSAAARNFEASNYCTGGHEKADQSQANPLRLTHAGSDVLARNDVRQTH